MVLAALLHDIGKFQQRAGLSIRHAECGADFCRSMGLPSEVCELVAAHHDTPSTPLQRYLVRADHISASERSPREDRGEPRADPLVSVFSYDGCRGFHYPAALALERECIFPSSTPHPKGQTSLQPQYKGLWSAFRDEFMSLKDRGLIDDDLRRTADQLYCLLAKYTSFIPSATYVHTPDIALFDHLRTAAAIARCLYETKGEEEFLLVGGDISGIQRFIYSVLDEHATKQLRGRSLYLSLLADAAAKHILRALDLPLCNLLYLGGGGFRLLVPSTPNTRAKLDACRRSIARAVYDVHQTDLYVAVEWVPWVPSGTDEKDPMGYVSANERLIELLNRKKRTRKLSELLDDGSLFEPRDVEHRVCVLCGRRPATELCEVCERFYTLAKDLVHARYLVELWLDRPRDDDVFSKLGFEFHLLSTLDEVHGMKGERLMVRTLNTCDWPKLGALDYPSPIVLDTVFMANTVARRDGGIMSLDDMVKGAENEGIDTWAALRMDVDDLGKKFEGSPSRVSTMSRMLSLFFGGWVNEVCRKYGRVYVVYSGGDDVFVVGRWNEVLDIARTIRNDLEEFTCSNPEWSISAGIFISPDTKYPVRRGAVEAGKLLDASKDNKLEADKQVVKRKDSITLLNTTCFWDEYLGKVLPLVEDIEGKVAGIASKAFVHRLYAIHDVYRRYSSAMEKVDDRYGRWGWLLAYVLAREPWLRGSERSMLERQIIEAIKHLRLIARMVELRTRGD